MRQLVSVDSESKELPSDVSMSENSTLSAQVSDIVKNDSYLSFDNRAGTRVLTKDPTDPDKVITIHAETGLRNIKDLWEVGSGVDNSLGTIFITREKNTVTLFLSGIKLKSTSGRSYQLPSGFKPLSDQVLSTSAFITSSAGKVNFIISVKESVFMSLETYDPNEYIYGQLSWYTTDLVS